MNAICHQKTSFSASKTAFEALNRYELTIVGEMMAGHSYRDLDVWHKAMDLVVECYKRAHRFPPDEKYGLVSQIQRASVSIPANIAEGQARQYVKEFIHHLSIAQGSLAEVETYVQLAERLGYVNNEKVQGILPETDHVARMIAGLQKSLKKPKTNN